MRLLDAGLWPGESPELELEITNTSDRPLRLIKKDKLTRYSAIHVRTLDSDGKPVPGWWLPSFDPPTVPTPEEIRRDSFPLTPGATTKMEFDSLTRPPSAGRYTMYVTYSALGKRHELKIPYEVVDIPADDILDRRTESLGDSYGNFAGDRWEVLKVRVDTNRLAVLRIINKDVPGVESCHRLFEVDTDAKLQKQSSPI